MLQEVSALSWQTVSQHGGGLVIAYCDLPSPSPSASTSSSSSSSAAAGAALMNIPQRLRLPGAVTVAYTSGHPVCTLVPVSLCSFLSLVHVIVFRTICLNQFTINFASFRMFLYFSPLLLVSSVVCIWRVDHRTRTPPCRSSQPTPYKRYRQQSKSLQPSAASRASKLAALRRLFLQRGTASSSC